MRAGQPAVPDDRNYGRNPDGLGQRWLGSVPGLSCKQEGADVKACTFGVGGAGMLILGSITGAGLAIALAWTSSPRGSQCSGLRAGGYPSLRPDGLSWTGRTTSDTLTSSPIRPRLCGGYRSKLR